MRQRGVPLDIVQQILGHSDIKSTERYAHIGEQTHSDAVAAIADIFEADTCVAQPVLKVAK